MVLRVSGGIADRGAVSAVPAAHAAPPEDLNQVSREQVGLLRQFRAGGDEEVREALLMTINCAAAGFGATG